MLKKPSFWSVAIVLAFAGILFAASPTFTSFNSSQFGTNATSIWVASRAPLTNLTGFNSATVTNPAGTAVNLTLGTSATGAAKGQIQYNTSGSSNYLELQVDSGDALLYDQLGNLTVLGGISAATYFGDGSHLTGITGGSGIPTLNGIGTNTTFISTVFTPTNTYLSSAPNFNGHTYAAFTLSATSGGYTFTSTQPIFTTANGWVMNAQFTTSSDNAQYWVTTVISSTQVQAHREYGGGALKTYSGENCLVSPVANYTTDDNGVVIGSSVGGDGAIAILGGGNSGALRLVSGSSTFGFATDSNGELLVFDFFGGVVIRVNTNAPNNAFLLNSSATFNVNLIVPNSTFANVLDAIAANFTNSANFAYATASTLPIFDSSKNLVSSSVSSTEAGYLSGVTSAIQTQLNGKLATGATLVGDVTGTPGATVVSTVNSVPASAVAAGATAANNATSANTASRIVVRDGSGNFAAGTITGTLFIGNGASITNLNAPGLGHTNQVPTQGTNIFADFSGNPYINLTSINTNLCVNVFANGANNGSAISFIVWPGPSNILFGIPTNFWPYNLTIANTNLLSFVGTNVFYAKTTNLSCLVVSFATATNLASNPAFSNILCAITEVIPSASSSGGGITAGTGDVTFSGSGSVATTVAFVNSVTAANVGAGANLANAATSANTASTIVKRDANGAFVANGINITNISESSIQWSNSAVLSAVTNYAVTYGTSWINYINPPDTNICFSSFVGTQGSFTFVIPQSRSNVWVLFPTNFYGNIVGPTNLFTTVGTNFMLAKSSPKSVMTIQFIASTNITSNPSFTNQSVYISDTGSPQTFNGTFTGSFSGNGAGMTNFNYYRAGQQNITSLSTSQAVTFSSSLPNTNYAVSVLPDSTLAAAVGFGVTSKTTSGFTITLSAGITGATTVDWTATPNQ